MRGGHPFLKQVGKFLGVMETEAKKRNAPVFMLEGRSGGSPFRILVYTMLSARTRDDATIGAAERLFAKYSSTREIANADEGEIEELIYPVGFYRAKARHLKKMCRMLDSDYGGNVPRTLNGLTSLPGVGLKTANIVLARAFGKNTIGVDTHVHRISNRLGIIRTGKPQDSSIMLNRKIPAKYRTKFNRTFVGFGQTVCKPVRPLCAGCPVAKACKKVGVR